MVYESQGHGDQPYYVSFLDGADTRQEVLELLKEPGGQLLKLQVRGGFVSDQGIDWERCEPNVSELCQLARFFESLSLPLEDIPYPGESNRFVLTGSVSAHPLYGFLIWPMHIERNLNVCGAVDMPQGVWTQGDPADDR